MSFSEEFESVNYNFLGVTIIVLLITFFILSTTKSRPCQKIISMNKKVIKVKKAKGDFMLEPNIFEMHIKRLKRNLWEMVKTKNIILDLGEIEAASKSIDSYIRLNAGDSYYLIAQKNKVESDLLMAQLNSDDDSKLALLDIIVKLNAVMALARNSLYKGEFDLNVINQISYKLRSNVKESLVSEPENINDMLKFIDMPDNFTRGVFSVPAPSRHSVDSHETTEYDDTIRRNNSITNPDQGMEFLNSFYAT